MSEKPENDRKKCPLCGFDKKLADFSDSEICNDCTEKKKIAGFAQFIKRTSSLFKKAPPKGDQGDDGSGGIHKLQLQHTRDVTTLANEIELDRQAQLLREALEAKDEERSALGEQKELNKKQEKLQSESEETLDITPAQDKKEERAEQLPEEEEKEREKQLIPDENNKNPELKNTARFRQQEDGQKKHFNNLSENRLETTGLFHQQNIIAENTKKQNNQRKLSQLYKQSTETGKQGEKLIADETKRALEATFRRWR